jgi:C-terminal processing protease CtpA/Prc/L-ascorbate metabolism protein UlaG (beta-lactamase superfamily)
MKCRRMTFHVAGLGLMLLSLALVEARDGQTAGGTSHGAAVSPAVKDSDPIPESVRQETFRIVWETIRDKYFDETFGGIDWTAVKAKYLPKLKGAKTSKAFHDLLNRMVLELPVSHLRVLDPSSTQPVVAGAMVPDSVELRAGDEGILVFAVPEGSPAWRAGLRPGTRILGVGPAMVTDRETVRRSPQAALIQTGGGVNTGVDRLAKFLLADPGLVAIETTRAGERREWRHEGNGDAAYRGAVAILVDEGSGSASEVFAALLQERGRAVVVGQTSYGGVLSSTQVPLPTQGVLHYPYSDLKTPNGRRLEGHGVTPDIPVELKRADLLAGKDTVLERAIDAVVSSTQTDSVTLVGNSGFLIRVGNKKVLVDAVFEGFPGAYAPPAAVQELVLNGRAPFDDIDLVLATHSHADHFTPAAVSRCLKNNPRAVFVGPPDAVAQVTGAAGRTTALDVPDGQRRSLQVNGISIDAMPLSHGTPPPGRQGIVNLAYVITAGGVRLLHTGDIDASIVGPEAVRALCGPGGRIDVALVAHFFLSSDRPLPLVTEGINARRVVASHLQYTDQPPDYERILRHFPDAVLLKTELARWPLR